MRERLIILIVLIACALPVWSQQSAGGSPIDLSYTTSLKSQTVVRLPRQDNAALLRKSRTSAGENKLKPFRFAEPIDVDLSTLNSGSWSEVGNYRVWQLVLVSSDAKSLNLIFDRYHLPEDARLFLFSPDQSDLLGAFTKANNRETGVFATSPVAGDHLVIQYEEPLNAEFQGELSIAQVNHDFVGIKSLKSDRRPLGIPSGDCNVNINCDVGDEYAQSAEGVCRIIISGIDLCTGTLINNTRNDGTPYLYTAAHCINTDKDARESVFLFNYESPYCGEIDGDASHSLSGSSLRAASDSLDFSLVELNVVPPANYRPYYLGWDRTSTIPDSSVSIHHPSGDVKKISIDRHSPQIKSYSQKYIKDAFFFIGGWEEGTTEGGSSGGPLINSKKRVIGSLTGGAASCESPFRDYFAMFHHAWDRYDQDNKQLKKWLDPTNSNVQVLDGLSPYPSEEVCGAFTNFRDEDDHAVLSIDDGSLAQSYWSGTNNYGFEEFAERFEKTVSSEVAGVSLGVSKAVLGNRFSEGKIRVSVYEGDELPQALLYSQEFSLKNMDEGVMNYLEFYEKVPTEGPFFVAYSLELLEEADTFAVYLADREVEPLNSFYIKDGQEWYTYQEKTTNSEGSALLMEVVLCNVDTLVSDDSLKNTSLEFEVFPNPVSAGQPLMIKFKEEVDPYIIQVFDLMGRQVKVKYDQPGDRWLRFDFTGQVAGNYFIKIVERKKRHHARVMYLGE